MWTLVSVVQLYLAMIICVYGKDFISAFFGSLLECGESAVGGRTPTSDVAGAGGGVEVKGDLVGSASLVS